MTGHRGWAEHDSRLFDVEIIKLIQIAVSLTRSGWKYSVHLLTATDFDLKLPNNINLTKFSALRSTIKSKI